MSTAFGFPFKRTAFALTVGLLASVAIPMCGQEAQEANRFKPIAVNGIQITGYPDDWTQHRVVFTNPGKEEEAYRLGRHDEWLRTVNDPRYVLRALKRYVPAEGPAAADVAASEAEHAQMVARLKVLVAEKRGQTAPAATADLRPVVWRNEPEKPRSAPASNGMKQDWNLPLTTSSSYVLLSLIDTLGTTTGGLTQPNVYPAKYTYNANGTPSCPNDYIVYPTGLAGITTFTSGLGLVTNAGTPNIIAYNNMDTGILSGVTSCGTILDGVLNGSGVSTSVIPNPTVMWSYNTGGAVTGSPILSLDGSQVAYVQQTSSTSTTAQLVLLKWSSPGNVENIVDVNVLGINLGVGTPETINGTEYSYGTADLLGLNVDLLNPYYTPNATAPTSVSCSTAGGAYQTHVAGEGTGTAPTPYMCVMTLKTDGGTATTVSHSSPFPDYLNGAIYVGDDLGYLHMFTGTSFGEPGTKTGEAGSTAAIAENAPLNLGKGFPLGAPAYDTVSGCVFVGDSAGYLYKIDPGYAGGTVCNSGTFKLVATTAKLASASTNGILDSPIVDSNNQYIYVSVSSSSGAGGLSTGSNAIYEFQTTFAGSAAPQGSEAVGTGGSTLEFLDGDFDNVYYSSTNGTGNMYVVGNTHTTGGGTLYQIPVSSNTMGTPVAMGTINSGSSHYAYSSPIMEFCNNGGAACTATSTATTSGVDTIYFSTYEGAMSVLGHVVNLLTNTNCSVGGIVLVPGGCIYGVNVSTPSAPSVYAAYYTSWAASATNPCWVTGGFVVDNAQTSLLDLNTIGAGSQMYFVGMNGNSSSLLSSYDPCGATKTTGNVIDAQQIGQGDLVL